MAEPVQFDGQELIDSLRKSRGPFLWALILIAAAAFVLTSVYTVEPDGKAVVKRFGKVYEIAGPGLHFKLPLGIDTATFVPTERILKEEFGFRTDAPGRRTKYRRDSPLQDESLMLSGDLNVIDVQWVVQFRVRDPDKYLHQVRKPEETIRDISEAVMRRVVGNRLGSEVLTVARVSVASEVRDAMQAILDDYKMGVQLIAVELQDVTPPDAVKPAFNKVNEARQERERLINEAEKERNRLVPTARGEAKQTIAEAKGYATNRINEAKGASSRFSAILKEYTQAPAVTRRRLYLEALDDVLPSVGKIYIMPDGATGALPLLNLTEAGLAPRPNPTQGASK